MKIKMNCPHCKAVMLIPGKAAGLKARCSACLKLFAVPWVKEAIHDKAVDWLKPDEDQEANENADEPWTDVEFDQVDSPMRG